jgi:hypothetical protein
MKSVLPMRPKARVLALIHVMCTSVLVYQQLELELPDARSLSAPGKSGSMSCPSRVHHGKNHSYGPLSSSCAKVMVRTPIKVNTLSFCLTCLFGNLFTVAVQIVGSEIRSLKNYRKYMENKYNPLTIKHSITSSSLLFCIRCLPYC